MRASASHRVPRASQHDAIFAESSYFGSVQLSPLHAPFLISSMLAIGTVCAVRVYLQWPLAAHAVGWMSSVTAPYQFCWQQTRRSIRPPVCPVHTRRTRHPTSDELRRRTVHIAHTYLCAVRFTTLFDTAIPIAALRRRICCTVHASITRSPMAACMVWPCTASLL